MMLLLSLCVTSVNFLALYIVKYDTKLNHDNIMSIYIYNDRVSAM